MSPGLTLRPSLSGALQLVVPETVQGVAGVDAPAFVERLRVTENHRLHTVRLVSPGLTLRPSLSGALQLVVPETVQGVAGVDAPAFVERLSLR